MRIPERPVPPPTHKPHDDWPEENSDAWWENTSKLSQEPQLPMESERAVFLEEMQAAFAKEAVQEFIMAISKVECRFILQMVAPVLELPDKKLKAFVWTELKGRSACQTARDLKVDHKTVIKWREEVRATLRTPHWGATNDQKTSKTEVPTP